MCRVWNYFLSDLICFCNELALDCSSSDKYSAGDPFYLAICRWHGYSGISVSSVRGWYGGFGEYVTGMPIRELLTSAKLAMPIMNDCK